MIKPNWDIFKAKFSNNPQNNFEWFCYILFCQEFDQKTGIFRYKNQSAVENAPIEKDNEIIGWQAKFYGDSLSKTTCKNDLIAALEHAKRDYPNITKFIFYSNQEWGQNKGKDPQGKKDVDNKAISLDIKFEWRTASFFESNFVAIDNEIIATHFFSLNQSFFELISNQQQHNENILDEIKSEIVFNGRNIKLNRADELKEIEERSEQVLILSGTGGVGKTALIKDYYYKIKDKFPFYIFKATEFELRSINDFFQGLTFQDFINGHNEDNVKVITIDSAERLLDFKNQDPFKEFLNILLKNNWRIIFTTRDGYLSDLNFESFEIYGVTPSNINLKNLSSEQLDTISENNDFVLPKDGKLLDFIRIPFYLSEYLKFYKKDEQIDYTGFKDKLWNKIIIKSKPAREQCFLDIVAQRANNGYFFIKPSCESSILDELKQDGVLGYESPHGYFITHDIYEEWALEKNIEVEFGKNSNPENFFQSIGDSLPFRRGFRGWLSEKLLLEDENIKLLIQASINNDKIKPHWKDEILVSILLSDYSCTFFNSFKEDLLSPPEKIVKREISSKLIQSLSIDYKYEENLLHKIFFLIRIACKELDDSFFRQLGVKDTSIFSLEHVFTKPKGKGWDCLVKFVYDNFDKIGIKNFHFILPIIHDWASKIKTGETTKYCGLMAVKYYQWTIKEGIFISDDGTKNKILQTIIYSCSEIKYELEEIFKEIIKNKWKNHRDPYYDLCKIVLNKIDGIPIATSFPKYVLEIADLFWTFTPKENGFYSRSGIDIEEEFNIEDNHLDYFPSSSYQTPVYWLLKTSLKETVDFILNFTNKSVEYFSKTEFAKYEVDEVEVFVSGEEVKKQYISDRLWCIYRGTQACPHVLESMHMALEKFFLENSENTSHENLESWLLYLVRNSKSASISAIVASIVIAFPDKTFNIAKILFKTKDFFHFDQVRMVLDLGQKNQLLSLEALSGKSDNDFHQQERIKACDYLHRKQSLENLVFNYQFFKNNGISDEVFQERQKEIWRILDDYYKKLSNKSKENHSDKTWRLCLARMDRRKMKIETEEKNGQTLVKFEPDIDPGLKEWSEKSLEENSESMKYSELRSWVNCRKNHDFEGSKKYKKYEEDPLLALNDVMEISKKLKDIKKPEQFKTAHTKEESFYLFNNSIPVDVCSILLRDYFDKLLPENKEFCKCVVIGSAESASALSGRYQFIEGSDSAISILPKVFEKFPTEKSRIKKVLLFALFNTYPIGLSSVRFNIYAIRAIHEFWEDNFDDANSLLLGYLLIKHKYVKLREKIRQENYKKGNYGSTEQNLERIFLKEIKSDLKKILENNISLKDVGDIEKIEPYILETALQIVPLNVVNVDHEKIVNSIILIFAQHLLSYKREDRIDPESRLHFIDRFTRLVLNSTKEKIQIYLKPFLDGFNASDVIVDILKEFILVVDQYAYYDNFWSVWDLFYDKIVEICKKGDGYWHADRIIKSYLFAQTLWKENAENWHVINKQNLKLFENASRDLGHCSSTLYSISKFLNDIGSEFLDDGVNWVSYMLINKNNLWNTKLEVNTIYYIENFIKKFIYKNREKIKRDPGLKEKILIILEFLIKKGSVVGYMLRENIL